MSIKNTVFVYIDIPSDEISYLIENSVSLHLRTICSTRTGCRSVESFSQLLAITKQNWHQISCLFNRPLTKEMRHAVVGDVAAGDCSCRLYSSQASRLRAAPFTGGTSAKKAIETTSKQRAERRVLFVFYNRSLKLFGWISRWLLLAMETYSGSHKKQKLSNAAESWVSFFSRDCFKLWCFNASISSRSSNFTNQLPMS